MYAKHFPICTVGLYVSLCLMIFLCPFLPCKALRTAMYKRYISSIIIILSTPASDVHERLKTNDIAIKLQETDY